MEGRGREGGGGRECCQGAYGDMLSVCECVWVGGWVCVWCVFVTGVSACVCYSK